MNRKNVLLVVPDTLEANRIRRLPRIHGTSMRRDGDGTIWGTWWRDMMYDQFRPMLAEDGLRLIYPDWLRGDKARRDYLLGPPASRRRVSILTYRWIEEGVEAAIRMARNHIAPAYVPEVGEEAEQMETVIALAQELSATFLDYQNVTDEVVEGARAKTAELIHRLGLERARLPGKQALVIKIAKASSLRDSLGRRNLLVTLSRLYSAYLLAVRRLESFGVYTSKYQQQAHALMFERGKMRWAIGWTVEELQRRILAHANFKCPDAKVYKGTPQSLAKMIEGIARGPLLLVRLKPYFPVAKEAGEGLFEAARLVRREDFADARDVVEGTVRALEDILADYEGVEMSKAA